MMCAATAGARDGAGMRKSFPDLEGGGGEKCGPMIHEWNYGFIYLSYKLHFCYLAKRGGSGGGQMMMKGNDEKE